MGCSNGLNGTVGDLMVVPRSQNAVVHSIPPSFNKPDDVAQWGEQGGPADLPGQTIFGPAPNSLVRLLEHTTNSADGVCGYCICVSVCGY